MKTYHLVNVSLIWMLVAIGIVILALSAYPSNAKADECNVLSYDYIDCALFGGGQRKRKEKQYREEQLRLQQEALWEQQRQTQIMRNNQFNNQFNSYGVYK